MAKVSAFGFTNTTDSANTVTAKALGIVTNYTSDNISTGATQCKNCTTPTDQDEWIEFRSRVISDVKSQLPNNYPSKVKRGVEYGIKYQTLLSTTDSVDPSFRVDEPINCTITFTHPRSGNITDTQIAVVFVRVLSALMKSNGTWRFDELMRTSHEPKVD